MSNSLRRTTTGWVAVAGRGLCVLIVSFAFIANTASANGITDTVALKGDAALDGNGLLNNLEFTPVVNDQSQVLFVTRYAFTSGISNDNYAAILYDDGLSTQLVREGEAAPDGNGTFLDFRVPMLSNNGTAALYATFTGNAGGFADDLGIISINGGTNIVVREGDSANGDGTYMGLNNSTFPPLAMNGLGQVAVLTRLTGTLGGFSTDGSIVVGDGAILTEIVREDDPTPAGNGNYGSFGLPVINDAGTVAFFGGNFTNLNPPLTDNMAIVTQSGGIGTEIVRSDDASPDGNGTFNFLNDDVALGSTGYVAFSSSFKNTTGGLVDAFAMVRGDSTSLDIIARSGDAALDGNGVILSLFPAFGSPQVNGFGDVAFGTLYTGTAGGPFDDDAILKGNVKPGASTLVEVVREGWTLPGGDGEFANIDPDIHMNEAGAVAFTASLRNFVVNPPGDDLGIFLGDGIDLVKVVQIGDTLDGFTVVQISAQGFGITEGGLNRHGQVAFRAKLIKTGPLSEGIFLFTPDLYYRTLGGDFTDPTTDWDVGLTNSGEINDDAREHWTLGLIPASVHNVIIDNGSRISRPASDTTVRHMTIGSPAVFGDGLIVQGGTHFTATDGILIDGTDGFTWLSAQSFGGPSEISGDIRSSRLQVGFPQILGMASYLQKAESLTAIFSTAAQ